MKLCNLLEPALIRQIKHCPRDGIITPEIHLHCCIRWLSDDSWWSCCNLTGVSKTAFCSCCHRTISAINNCEELGYHFPNTPEELEEAAADFRKISSHGVIAGCVGALDGLLIKIETPSSKEVPNVRSFFSGHYHHMGLNIQACCDAHCRFVYFSAGHPGSTNDSIAHRHSPFPDMLEKLPLRKYIIADNAYNATEHLITPFCGVNKNDKAKDAFNYYLSQCRIRIECTFGRLVNKFQIFKRPLRCSVHNSTRMVYAATRLHNWCINHGSEDLLTLKHSEADLEGLPDKSTSNFHKADLQTQDQ